MHKAPDGSGEWESNAIVMRALELDPLRDDVGVDNPYTGGGDGLGSYPSNGDPTDFQMGCAVDGYTMPCEKMSFFVRIAGSIEQIGGVRVPIPIWVLNPDEEPGDACKDGVCPPEGITVYDTGGHFEVAGYNTFTNQPAMRQVIPNGPLDRARISSLIDSIYKMFKDHPGCEEFTNALLGELKNSTGHDSGNIRDILEKFRVNGRIIAFPNIYKVGNAGPLSISVSDTSVTARDAETVMGEIIHSVAMPNGQPGLYDDQAMADAIRV